MRLPEAFQHFLRFKYRFQGPIDLTTYSLDTSAHPENVHEAVVQEVIHVVRQAFNARYAQILDPVSAVRSRLAFHDATPSRGGKHMLLFDISEGYKLESW